MCIFLGRGGKGLPGGATACAKAAQVGAVSGLAQLKQGGVGPGEPGRVGAVRSRVSPRLAGGRNFILQAGSDAIEGFQEGRCPRVAVYRLGWRCQVGSKEPNPEAAL